MRRRAQSLGVIGHATTGARHVSNGANIVGVGVAARRGFRDAKDSGQSTMAATAQAVATAAPQAVIASAPFVAPLAGRFADHQLGAAQRSSVYYVMSKKPATLAKHLMAKRMAVVAGTGFKALSFVAKRANPLQAIVGATQGAIADSNDGIKGRVRGAIRGALTSYDPTEVLAGVSLPGGYKYDKGIAASLVDSVLGAPTKSKPTPYIVPVKDRGFRNKNNQRAAQEARKRKVIAA